jgi:hypothetical protein
MNERRKIEDRIKKKEAEIADLEGKIRDARVYMQALGDVLKLLPRESDSGAADSDTPLRAGSTVSQARVAILSDGSPMHINKLLEVLGKEQTRENVASLGSSLAAYVRRSEIFTRPAPNTFGLAELGHFPPTVAEPPPAPEPPSGFGALKGVETEEDPF